jgi:hypothetical protein
LLAAWNSALDQRDADKLVPLYAPRVRFYSSWKSAKEVIGAKRRALEQVPDYRQRIEDVRIDAAPNGGFVVHFKKRSGSQLSSVVDARLAFEATADGLLISEESDAPTDQRQKRAPDGDCYGAVMRIVGAQPVIQADIRRVRVSDPEVNAGGILYDQSGPNLQAAQGYFHAERFEPRWWIDVVNGVLTIRDAATSELLALSEAQLAEVRRACLGSRAASPEPAPSKAAP